MPVSTLKLTNPPADDSQGFLSFPADIIEKLKEAEARGEYTAERLKLQDPNKYRAIIELRGQDWSEKRIAELLKVHHRTIAAVSDAEPEAIDAFRQRLIKKLRRGADRLVDRIVEHPDTVPIHVAGLVATQLIDKAELLDGRANVRVEHVERVDIYGDWDSFVEKQLQPEDVIEISSETRLEGRKTPAIEAGQVDPAGECQTSGPARTDGQSEVSQGQLIESPDNHPGPGHRSGAAAGSGEAPPGGGLPPAGAPNTSTDNGSQKFSGNRSDQ